MNKSNLVCRHGNYKKCDIFYEQSTIILRILRWWNSFLEILLFYSSSDIALKKYVFSKNIYFRVKAILPWKTFVFSIKITKIHQLKIMCSRSRLGFFSLKYIFGFFTIIWFCLDDNSLNKKKTCFFTKKREKKPRP